MQGGKRRIATSGSPCSLLKESFCSQDADAKQRRRTKWQRATAPLWVAFISHTPATHLEGELEVMKNSLWRQGSRLGGNWKFWAWTKLRPTPMLPVFSHPFRLLCVHPLRRKMDNIFKYISDSNSMICSQQCPTELPGDRCNNYGNSVQSASRSMQYVGLDLAASKICFRLLFALLEQNHLLRCLQSSVVAVMVLISHKQPWRMDWGSLDLPRMATSMRRWGFMKKIGDCVVFFISMYVGCICVRRGLET